jgi:hypothetical protein
MRAVVVDRWMEPAGSPCASCPIPSWDRANSAST